MNFPHAEANLLVVGAADVLHQEIQQPAFALKQSQKPQGCAARLGRLLLLFHRGMAFGADEIRRNSAESSTAHKPCQQAVPEYRFHSCLLPCLRSLYGRCRVGEGSGWAVCLWFLSALVLTGSHRSDSIDRVSF